MILNVHFRHKKFVDEVKFAKVHKTRPKLKMTQISTFYHQFQILCPWKGKLGQIPLRKSPIVEFFTTHDFAIFPAKSTQKKKKQQNEENLKRLEIFQNLKIKAEEKWGAKPLTFLQL